MERARTTARLAEGAHGTRAPRVHVYGVAWNDRRVLPFFLRHYAAIAERIVVFDDGSTDGSRELLERAPKVEVRTTPRAVPGSMVESVRVLLDGCWKESRGVADWVIVVSADEHLYHADLPAYLERCRAAGVTLVPAIGYEMVSAAFPRDEGLLCDAVRRGVLFRDMHKPCLFDPAAIDEIHFAPGRHSAAPQGRVRYPDVDELRLLHYKHIGVRYLLERTAQLRAGLGEGDHARRYGWHWLRSDRALVRHWLGLWVRAHGVVATRPWSVRGWSYRWWRPQGGVRTRLRERLHHVRCWRDARRAAAPARG